MKKILFVFGTRPEAIKLSPLILKFREYANDFDVSTCVTGQHREMLYQVLDFFGIEPDFDLAEMKANQTLFDITANTLVGLESVFEEATPDVVIVQGDTTSAFVGALAAFYKQTKVAHIEAGLRSGDLHSPFPEEANRILLSRIADYHFTPTETASENLRREGITQSTYEVGNTVIDSLLMTHQNVKLNDSTYQAKFPEIDFSKKTILITGHRRESFGEAFDDICKGISKLAISNAGCNFIYPVHLNPNVRKTVFGALAGLPNVYLSDPVDYPTMVWLLGKSYLVLTDSGGIQEEAPALGKPVLVMRDVTERTEGIAAGTAKLVGTKPETIFKAVTELLENSGVYNSMAKAVNPYGDGNSCERIADVLRSVD